MKFDGQIIIGNESYTQQNYQQIATHTAAEEMWVKEVLNFLQLWYNEDETITVETTGSTGKPKSMALKKTSLIASAQRTNAYLQLGPTCNAMLCLPARYIAGKMMIVRALVGGYKLFVVEPTVCPLENTAVDITFVALTPMQAQASMVQMAKLQHAKIIVGGAALGSQLEEKLCKLLQHSSIEVYETYGMTETCSHIALRKISTTATNPNFELMEGITINTDTRSCLVISSRHLNIENLTTNDVVEILPHQQFRWLGRYDNIINSGGVKIVPEKIESLLQKTIEQRFFVGGWPDDTLNTKLVLFVESPSIEILNLAVINETLKALHRFERPKEIVCCSKFVSNNNKVLRSETVNAVLNRSIEHRIEKLK